MKHWLAGTLLVLAPLSVPGAAGAQEREQPRTISVNAAASVDREPERAELLLAVESEAPAAQQASQANASSMEQVIRALQRAGIARASIRTVSYSLNPVYTPSRGTEPPRISGYRAVNMVRITVDDLAKLGAVIDASIEAGANRVAGLEFQLKDVEEARLEALEKAIAIAKREAEVAVRAADQRLGVPMNIQTSYGGWFPRPMQYDMIMAEARVAAAPTPVEGGTLTVTANVSIVYRLENR